MTTTMTTNTTAPPTIPDARASWSGCVRVTPYQRGFEDYAYGRVYANPYRVGTPRWVEYERGSEDARWAARVGR